MLVVNPTPYSLPLNTANVPTEAVETQNRFAERIPQTVPAFESTRNKAAESDQHLSDSDRIEKNAEIREKIIGSKEEEPEQQSPQENPRQSRRQELQDRALISNLAAIDRRVRAHEQAHSSVGGIFAGSPSFTYKTGPNGVRYAVGGEVPIDVSPISGNPQATLRKATQVARAALAPADPSSTDRRIASTAQAIASRARFEISRLNAQKLEKEGDGSGVTIHDDNNASNTSFSGGQLHAALATDATEQIGGQISASA